MVDINIKKIIKILDSSEYSIDQQLIKNHCIDWRGHYIGNSDLIVFPKTSKKISEIIKICEETKTPIVPQGGNTSLVGGSVPRKDKNEIILNLKNLNKIKKVNLIDKTITVESGCILQSLKDNLEKYEMDFPLSMGSKGSCQIGGNIATNAGGLNYIKYGSIRENILGLEVVTTKGKIISNLNSIKKNNTGTDLKQIFIGSEGTLGIITAATFKIYKKPKEKVVVWVGSDEIIKILGLYSFFTNAFCDQISSFELMNNKSVMITDFKNLNVDTHKNFYCLIELSNFLELENYQELIYDKIKNINFDFENIIIAKNENENKVFWNIRESIPIEEKNEGFNIKHDVSIPLENMESFIKITEKEINKFDFAEIINFGHIGDNNLHYNVLIKKKKISQKLIKDINNIVFTNVKKNGGSISAEHGIGQLRKDDLIEFKTSFELEQMKSIKRIFDPLNIFNPGKVF